MISMSPALLPSEDRGEESVPASLMLCWQSFPFLASEMHCPDLCHPHMVFSRVCVCVQSSSLWGHSHSLYGDTVIGFGPVLVRSDLILTRLSSETQFPSKVTFTGLGGQDSQHSSWGHSSAYKREHGPQVDSPAQVRPIRRPTRTKGEGLPRRGPEAPVAEAPLPETGLLHSGWTLIPQANLECGNSPKERPC